MSPAAALVRLDIEPDGDGFLLVIEGEGRPPVLLRATRDQLDKLADLVDDALLDAGDADD